MYNNSGSIYSGKTAEILKNSRSLCLVTWPAPNLACSYPSLSNSVVAFKIAALQPWSCETEALRQPEHGQIDLFHSSLEKHLSLDIVIIWSGLEILSLEKPYPQGICQKQSTAYFYIYLKIWYQSGK